MKLRLLLLWTVLSFSGNSALAQTVPTAVLSPEGFNASLGSTVTFTCIINGTEDVLWIVDGISDPTVQRQRGITQNSTVGQPDGSFISRIHISSTMENNGIEILCRAIGMFNGQSETVTLLIQGLLSSPTPLNILDSGGSTRRLSWTPQPTIDLTDIHPDVSYNVCSSILNEVSCNDFQGTELLFVNVRIGIEFSVAAVNVLGESNASTINHEPCDSTTSPTQVDGDVVTSDTSLQSSGTTPSVTFSFEKGSGDSNCYNLYRIEASPSNQGTPLTQGPMFPTVSGGGDISVSVTSGLVRNTVYSVNIVSVNVNGENSSMGDIQFSAYDVQSIQGSTRPGAIAVTCSFTIGSVASSCIVRICEVVNGNVSPMCQNLSVPRNLSAPETTQELNNIQPGIYAIIGVTVNSGGEMIPFTSGDLRFLQLQNINITVGLLSSPTPLNISDSEGPTRRLSWTPPPTLEVISHYNVCSSILNEVSCNDVQGTELSFLNIRMEIEFSVAAVNVVGEGNASTINHEPCDSTTAPTQVDGDFVTSEISLQSNGTTPSVTFSFRKGDVDSNCFNLYRIEASPSNQGTPLTQGTMIPTVSGGEDISVSVTSGLVRNTVYSVNIVSVNVNGENSSMRDIQFSTYDIQSIQSSTRPGTIAVTCSFTTGSVESSCIVRICEVINGNISMMCQDLSVPRSPSVSETTQELNNLQPGVYAIVGVTVNSSGGEMIPFTSGDLRFLQLQNIEIAIGLLSSPTTLNISNSEESTQRLSWTPPPTLYLTDVISHYNVCSSILNEVSCNDVQGTELSFLNIRIGIEFSVAAVNVAGEGNANTINHEPCDSTTAPIQVDGDLVTSDISLQSSGTTPSVTFSFGKGGGDSNCFNLYRIEASPSNQGTPLIQGPMIPTVSEGENISVSVTSGLVRNTVYSVNIVSVNVNGENSSMGNIQFSAYDVQSIQSSIRSGTIAVTCSFTIGSVASSCIVRICEVINGNVSMMCQDLPVPRNLSASETTQELNGVQPGVYAIVGVTVNSGGEMIPFTSGDLRFLQLQSIDFTGELLSSPTRLNISDSEESIRRLSWTPPPTLYLIGIISYNVCSSILNEVSCNDVQGTELSFLNIRIGIEFSVAAVNVVGEGNASTINHEPCDSTTAPTQVDGDFVTSDISLQSSGTTPSVTFSFGKGGGESNCFNLYRIEASPSNQGTPLIQKPRIPTVSGGEDISVSVTSGLVRNTVYSVNIVSVNVNGENSSVKDIQFSAYDVQSIQGNSPRPGAIAITCSFTIGSVASSCIVRICEVVNGNVSMMCQDLSVPRNPSSSEATQELNNLQPGVYAIVGVTVNSSVELIPFTSGDLMFLQLQNINVTEESPTTPTMATEVTSDSIGDSSANAGIAAGVVGGIIGFVCIGCISTMAVGAILKMISSKRRVKKPVDENINPQLHPNEVHFS